MVFVAIWLKTKIERSLYGTLQGLCSEQALSQLSANWTMEPVLKQLKRSLLAIYATHSMSEWCQEESLGWLWPSQGSAPIMHRTLMLLMRERPPCRPVVPRGVGIQHQHNLSRQNKHTHKSKNMYTHIHTGQEPDTYRHTSTKTHTYQNTYCKTSPILHDT